MQKYSDNACHTEVQLDTAQQHLVAHRGTGRYSWRRVPQKYAVSKAKVEA